MPTSTAGSRWQRPCRRASVRNGLIFAGTDLLDLQAVRLIEQLQCSICSDFNPGTAPHLAYSQSMDGIRPDLMRTLPVVMCPGCNRAMIPGEPRKIMFSNDLVDVSYVCEQCGTTSVRIVKLDSGKASNTPPKSVD